MNDIDISSDIAEFLTAISRHDVPPDPISFARSLRITPDPWQADLLTTNAPQTILNCARQSGKSTTVSILALWRAITVPRSLILLISPSDRQSSELFRKITQFLASLPIKPELVEDNKHSLELKNGSRIVSLPASEGTVRGYSAVSLLIEDEAGDVPDDLYQAVLPMLAISRGQLILMGTPKGRRGHFFDAWENQPAHWKRIHITAAQNPRMPPEVLERHRLALGASFAQEYNAEFVDLAAGRVYGEYSSSTTDIDDLPVPSTHPDWTWVLGMDFGVVDSSAFTVLGWLPHSQKVYIAESYKLQNTIAPDAANEAHRLNTKYRFDRIVGDTSGLGKGFTEEMRRRPPHIPVLAAEKHNKLGYISLLNGALKRGELLLVRPKCEELAEEWQTLMWASNSKNVHIKRENPTQENHAADSALYGWRATLAYQEEAKPTPGPSPGTKEAYDAEHERMLQERIDMVNESHTRDWWDAD